MDKAWITPPAAVPSIRRGISFNVAGGLRVARGQFPMALDTDRTSSFSGKSAWTGSAPNIARFRRSRPYQHRVKHRPFHLGAAWSCRMRLLAWIRRGDVCLGGWSPMAAVVGGVLNRLPTAPWGQRGRYRGQGVSNPVSGVPRAAHPRRRNIARFKRRAGPARGRAEHRPLHAAVSPAHGPRRSCGQGCGAPTGRDRKGRCSAAGRQIQASPHPH